MAQNIRGWDQIYQLESRNIQKQVDKIILLVHWKLIINNSFKCCGLGNEKYLTKFDKESSSELLPDGWNYNNQYNIRYIYNDSLFILVGIEMSNDNFFIYLLHPDSEVLSFNTFKISNVVNLKPKNGKIPHLFNNNEILLQTIQKDLVDMVLKQSGKLKKPTPEIINRTENIRKRSTISPMPYWSGSFGVFSRDDELDHWKLFKEPNSILQFDY